VGYLEAVLLALVQGITEFLPISSSAHLILVPALLSWEDQGLAFDVAVHLGSLLAVCLYFRDEIIAICQSWYTSLSRHTTPDAEAMFGWYICIATVPAGLVGLFFRDLINLHLRDPLVIAATTGIFGVVLWLVDRRGGTGADEHTLNFRTALLIGCAQALAFIPGTSRSGITITAGLALGLSRQAAARFSFLMAIPVITLASLLEIWTLIQIEGPVPWLIIAAGTIVSCLSAYLCIKVFVNMLARVSMLPFAIYRVVLALILVVIFTT
jgi:undecaprenyl-diphosphatase